MLGSGKPFVHKTKGLIIGDLFLLTGQDDTGTVLRSYGISAFPTTFMIDAAGNVFGYVPGAMSAEIMQSIIDQTLAGKRE